MMIKIIKIISGFLAGFAGITALLFLASNFSVLPGFRAFTVLSGSMKPAVNIGSVVFVAPSKTYSSNDIVSFYKNGDKKDIVTHRIAAKIYSNDKPTYLTAGDANDKLDPGKIEENQIAGKVIFNVPYLGYFANFVQKPYGFILFVIIPATIIVYEELKKVKEEILSFYKKLRLKKELTDLRAGIPTTETPKRISVNRYYLIIIPIVASFLALTSFSLSYFSDREQTNNNSFQAGTWITLTPTPTTPIPTVTPIPTATPTPPIPTKTPTPALTCQSYCISLGSYTSGTCRNGTAQCRANGETMENGGNNLCTQTEGGVCCCKP